MRELASDPSGRVKVEACAPRNDIPYLKMEGTGSERIPVLIVGGVHARELAPPDALLNLAEVLLVAYRDGADIVYPSATVTETKWDESSGSYSGGATRVFPEWTYPQAKVAEIAENVDLYLLPLVNPDGRDKDIVDMSPSGLGGWRWNLSGVDLNRNFDIAWEWETFYDTATLARRYKQRSQRPSDTAVGEENYRGSSAASELETQNVQNLIRAVKPKYFLDVHQFGRLIMYPWFIEHNGTADESMRWSNPAYDGKRDGLPAGDPFLATTDYQEFHPDGFLNWVGRRHASIAADLRDAILESASALPDSRGLADASTYTPYAGIASMNARADGPCTGSTVDYAFSQYRSEQSESEVVFAFAMEAGHPSEGGFRPFYFPRGGGSSTESHYPKIEREIHAACLALLQQAASGWSESWPL